MLDIKTLLPELKKLVTDLSEDLLARSTAKNDPHSAEVDAGLREAYQQIEKGGRTAQAFEVWREDYLDQVSVAWVLGCVFVRFMEDNHLIDECWLAGNGDRRKLAEDTQELYFREHPHESDREYFEHVFHEVGKIPACRDLFAKGKTPLWAVGPSGDMAMKLLAFWREVVPETGELQRSFEVENGDTRFLGDLYQDLSERARKKYALLQTPVFVEEFILDRTLNPAIDEFGLDDVRMIDPTCGSGHFLLGSFARLFEMWIKREDNEVVAAQKALDGVWGCDINPFAVAIARFRLIVAALRACGVKRLKRAPAWNIHLATGDSLLFGSRWDREGKKQSEQQFLGTEEESWAPEIYACEDKDAIAEVLGQQYHAVVGNPPYIIVRDRSLNQAYRDRYSSCHQKYSLSVPFAERFFDIALYSANGRSGFVGQITANSFMKREFGKKLIEDFFPGVDLSCVIDTSGAYIPGHGTPTVILFGRNRSPANDSIRAILGIKGEPSTPEFPSQGLVWQSILRHVDVSSSEDDFTSSSDVDRSQFAKHPWSIGGGGASELKEKIEDGCKKRVDDVAHSIGFASFPGLDDAFVMDQATCHRKAIEGDLVKRFIEGEVVRDWCIAPTVSSFVPYSDYRSVIELDTSSAWFRHLWAFRTCLENIVSFGRQTRKELGEKWWAWYRWIPEKYAVPLSVTFSEVATHTHFVLDRGGRVFKNSAPVIKLPKESALDDHLALIACLNSSVVCFWLKQVCHNKGSTVDQHGARQRTNPFEDFYAFNSTRVGHIPLPPQTGVEYGRRLDLLGATLRTVSPDSIVIQPSNLEKQLNEVKQVWGHTLSDMRACQEELDWAYCRLYGLFEDDLCYPGDDLPGIELGQRAFEIVMARQMANGDLQTTWFERHTSKPITEIPAHWPEAYRKLVERRIELIETNKEIGLIEKPEYKRRWNTESWEDQERRALRKWLLERLESQHYWPDPSQQEPRLQSVAEMSDKASGDKEFLQVAGRYRGRSDFDVATLVSELVEPESVPFLPCLRYKPSGLRKRNVWETTWGLQRREDTGEKVGKIKVPPKYAGGDFQKTEYYKLRGKLDVPKERWISFPHCETESNPSLVVGWAGWDHLQQATAIIGYYDARKREGLDAKRLTPLLAGLDQLLPWIHQWHPEVDPEFGETAGQSFETMLKADAHELGLTIDEIRAWEPPKKTKTRRKRKTK
ncbi:Type I restriction-modification system methyltransferase subunit [Planctomycetales bacterium 10988]|nr:Type I restriction-modification system methyltransferase subunit [Planctomycetales bacterium 10988]